MAALVQICEEVSLQENLEMMQNNPVLASIAGAVVAMRTLVERQRVKETSREVTRIVDGVSSSQGGSGQYKNPHRRQQSSSDEGNSKQDGGPDNEDGPPLDVLA